MTFCTSHSYSYFNIIFCAHSCSPSNFYRESSL